MICEGRVVIRERYERLARRRPLKEPRPALQASWDQALVYQNENYGHLSALEPRQIERPPFHRRRLLENRWNITSIRRLINDD